MDIKDYVKKYNLPFDKVKSEFDTDFTSLYESEKEWLENLEDKVHLLKNEKIQAQVAEVISKLKTTESFNENDSKNLSAFVSNVNTIVRIANRINNFKEGTVLDNGATLKLYDFFNSVKTSDNLSEFSYPLNSNLNNFLPHIYSLIKHCQNPIEYPIYYKYWKNILREVLSKDDDYDSMCTFYRSFPSTNRHLNFATYLGTLGIQIVKNINSSGILITEKSKEYRYLTKNVISIARYKSILDKNLDKGSQYFLVGAYWDGSNPADQAPRFIENDIWANGYDDKFVEEVKAVQEGSKIAIKAVFTREKTKSVMAIKAKGVVVKNYDDGKKLDINWEKEFTPFEVDFSGGYWETIKEVTKQDHINQIFNHTANNDDVFLKTKMKFDVSIFKKYIKFLRKINSDLGLKPNDNRVVYSVRDNRLNFTVGQRYGFNLYLNDSRGVYGVISKEKLLDNSEPYDGTPPQPFYNYYTEFNPQNNEWNSIKDAIQDELNRTTKSGYRRYNNSDFENFVFEIAHEIISKKENMNFPLNTILYGPPGTGKTYNTINYALTALGIDLKGLSRDEIVGAYRDKIDAGEIVFTTFHQSISYEDFIEGIKPETNEGNVSYKLVDGTFKELCSSKSHFTINDLFGSRNQYKIVALSNTFLRIGRDSGVVDISMDFINEMLQLFFSSKISIEDFKTEKRDALREQFNTKWDKYLFGYDSMYKGIIEYVKNKNQASDSHKKVIIIDEINRGNISNIFGELITLIEEDKRIGSQNYTPVKLPYSKELFGVPNNLFIIGTMNTADRSVEALDTALRRRFSFIEMNPEPAKLNSAEFKCNGIDLEALLKAINARIEKLLDKDYCIGHSYFMTIKKHNDPLEEIQAIFENKILPLLQEYFYSDWGKILLVIGKEFVETKKNSIKFISTDSYEDFEEYDAKPIYNFTSPSSWTLASFKSIYE